MNYWHNNERVAEALAKIDDPKLYSLKEALLCKRILSLGREGQLSEEMLEGLPGRLGLDSPLRAAYSSSVSWAVYTLEYMESLKRLVRKVTGKERPQVLEVCAGKGMLGSDRYLFGMGIDLFCTDENPAADHVMKSDALTWPINPDAVFVSWIPYESKLDKKLAKKCTKAGIPLIIVGEGYYGCTGSRKFWNKAKKWGYQITPASQLINPFNDVYSWAGLSDYTSVVQPL